MKTHNALTEIVSGDVLARRIQMYPDKGQSNHKDFLICPSADGWQRIRISQIRYCLAEGNYTAIHYGVNQSILVSRTLGYIDQLLCTDRFLRVHQSFLVATRRIERFSPKQLCLDCGTEIPVARARKNEVREVFLNQGIRVSQSI